jgi:outer membrane receptor for ferrienterochelin and colicins
MRTQAWLGSRRVWRLTAILSGVVFWSMAAAWSQVTNTVDTPAAKAAVAEPPGAEAPEDTLEKLMTNEIPFVVGPSKYKQKVADAPASVTIISSDEVKKYGYRTLAEILQSAPGMNVTYDRAYDYLGVRGFSQGDIYTRNSRVLVLVDGHRMNNSLTDGAAIGTDFILDVDLIDRVEVIRGPGSSLYGNNAFFGVINVITRNGRDMAGYGGEVSGAVASYDSYKGRVTYGNRFKNGLELMLSGTYSESAGQDSLFYKEYNTPANNNGIAQNMDADDSRSAFGKLSFHDFNLEGGYIWRHKVNPTAQFYTAFNDPALDATDDRGYVSLKFEHEFPDLFDVTASLYYDQQNSHLTFPYPAFPPYVPYTLFEQQQSGQWWGSEVQFTRNLWDRLVLSLGGEYRDDFIQSQTDSTSESNAVYPTDRTRQSYGIYFEGDFTVLTNLHVNAGVRYDQYGDFDPAANPRAAVIYNPFGQSVFKAIYGTAFRTPNFYELAATNNPNSLQPETITSYELVYEQGIGQYLRSSLAGFYNEINNLIVFSQQYYQNLENATAKGLELSLEGHWPSGLRGRASYTLQETEDTTTGQVLADSPRHLAKMNLSVPLWKNKVFAGGEFLYTSSRATINQTQGIVTAGSAASYGIFNLTLFSQNLVKGLDVSATVYNLFDNKFYDPATPYHLQNTIQQDGRSFRVKLTYRF